MARVQVCSVKCHTRRRAGAVWTGKAAVILERRSQRWTILVQTRPVVRVQVGSVKCHTRRRAGAVWNGKAAVILERRSQQRTQPGADTSSGARSGGLRQMPHQAENWGSLQRNSSCYSGTEIAALDQPGPCTSSGALLDVLSGIFGNLQRKLLSLCTSASKLFDVDDYDWCTPFLTCLFRLSLVTFLAADPSQTLHVNI